MFVHAYVHVSVAALGLGKSNTQLSGPVCIQAHVSALLIAALTLVFTGVCVGVCACVFSNWQPVRYEADSTREHE